MEHQIGSMVENAVSALLSLARLAHETGLSFMLSMEIFSTDGLKALRKRREPALWSTARQSLLATKSGVQFA